MKIKADFTNSGTPVLGLTPTIRIRELPTTLVVTDEAMTESGDGTYFYDYGAYDVTKDYTMRCDGGASLSDTDRYKYAGNESYYEDMASAVWSENTSGYSAGDTFGYEFTQNQVDIKRLLGLMHENIYIDNPIYDGDGNLTSARIRLYSVPGSVGSINDVIGTYEITSPGSGAGRFSSWKQVKV